jgi:hypothetical protein
MTLMTRILKFPIASDATNEFINNNENCRRDAFLPSLNKVVGHTFVTLSESDVVTLSNGRLYDDSDFESIERCRKLIAAAIAAYDTNELGRGGTDPSIQGVLSTIRFWVQYENFRISSL